MNEYALIPEELKARRQWVCWRLEERGGQKTKVPLIAGTKHHASTTDPETWRTFAHAAEAFDRATDLAGIGFVFSAVDPYVGIDWDKCRDNGVVSQEVAEAMIALGSYGEVSYSGTGCHLILRGQLPPGGRRSGQVEIYDRARYFAMTGQHCQWTPTSIEDRQAELEAFYRRTFPNERASDSKVSFESVAIGDIKLDPNANPPFEKFTALLENSSKFRKSWEHKRKDFPKHRHSTSEYDLSLATIAFQAGWKPQEVVDLLISHRHRYGEDLKLRENYYLPTLRKARAVAVGDEDQAAEIDTGLESGEETPEASLSKLSALLGLSKEWEIKRLVKVMGEPPLYRLYVGDQAVTLRSCDTLLTQLAFRRTLFDATGILMADLRPTVWRAVTRALVRAMETVEAENEADGMTGFRLLVDSYVEDSEVGEANEDYDWQEDAVRCVPFVHEGRVWVSVPSLTKYIHDKSGQRITNQRLAQILKVLGWASKKHSPRFGGKQYCRAAWTHPDLCADQATEPDPTYGSQLHPIRK